MTTELTGHGPFDFLAALDGRQPLRRHVQVRTRDVGRAQDVMARFVGPHRLIALRGVLELTHASASVGAVTLHYVDAGAEVRFEPGARRGFHLVQIPLEGRVCLSNAERTWVAEPRVGLVSIVAAEDRSVYTADGPRLMVQVPSEVLERRFLQAHPGACVRGLRTIGRTIDFGTPAGRFWLSLLASVLVDLDHPAGVTSTPANDEYVQNMLVDGLARLLPDSDEAEGPIVGKALVEAMDVIHARAREPLTLAGLAAEVHLSPRALQKAFRSNLGTTPTKYLQHVRLRAVHEALAEAQPGEVSVSEVARGWGLTHLGRFSAAYRAMFGENPSDTLRNCPTRRAPEATPELPDAESA